MTQKEREFCEKVVVVIVMVLGLLAIGSAVCGTLARYSVASMTGSEEDEMTLEKRIESACDYLPEGWRIRIDIERDAADVTAIRPDGTKVHMSDGERDIEEQVTDAICLARDETSANASGEGREV